MVEEVSQFGIVCEGFVCVRKRIGASNCERVNFFFPHTIHTLIDTHLLIPSLSSVLLASFTFSYFINYLLLTINDLSDDWFECDVET